MKCFFVAAAILMVGIEATSTLCQETGRELTKEEMVKVLRNFEVTPNGYRLDVVIKSDTRPGSETIETTEDGNYRRIITHMESKNSDGRMQISFELARYVSFKNNWGFCADRQNSDPDDLLRLRLFRDDTQRVLGLCSFSSALAFGVVDGRRFTEFVRECEEGGSVQSEGKKLECNHPRNGKLVFEFDDKDRLNRVHQMKEVGDYLLDSSPALSMTWENIAHDLEYSAETGTVSKFQITENQKDGLSFNQMFELEAQPFVEDLGEAILLPSIKLRNGTLVSVIGKEGHDKVRHEFKDQTVVQVGVRKD